MNKVVLFWVNLLPFICMAQIPVITNSITPVIGHSSTYRFFDAEITSPGIADTAVTWDFSALSSNGTGVYNYKDPSTLPGAGQFPAANVGIDQNGDPIIFLKGDNAVLAEIGIKVSTVTENYSTNPKELLRFPITYGSVFTDNFEGSATLSSFTATRTGDITTEADGYGTLILPYATFNNVLRVKSISVYEDKLLTQTVNSGTDTVFSFYQEGQENYLLTWSHINSATFGSVYYGAYLDTMYVGILERAAPALKLSISPNPTSGFYKISCDKITGNRILLEIFDLSGRRLRSYSFENSGHRFVKEMYAGDLEKGMYVLKLSGEGEVLTENLIVE